MTSNAPTFSTDFFKENRRRLRELFAGSAPIVITANGALQSDSYSSFAFRQDSNFWYLTGIDDPDIILVMDRGHEYLIVPERTAAQIAFDGELDYEAMRATSGINKVLQAKQGWERLGKRIKLAGQVATLEPSAIYIPASTMYSNPARRCLVRRLKACNTELHTIDLRPHLMNMRMVKSETELAAIQYAIGHTVEIYKLIGKNLANYSSEQDVAADVARYFIQNQLGYAYDPIFASGANATILHYRKNNAPLVDRDCFLIDLGACAGPYYCADITRTVAVKPSKRAQTVYAAVLAIQQFAIDYLKPGVLIKDYEMAVNQFMGEKLRELGLIRIIDQESARQFYPHGTSHFLGLDVHDVGDYTKPLKPGIVLTVEPGIYIKDESIGIRIEDDILITAKGNRVLSAGLPKSLSSLTMSLS